MCIHISTTMASRIFMDGYYYLMDAFISLILSMVSGMAIFCIYCSPISFAGYIQMAYLSHAIAEIFGQPISVDDSCVMRKYGSWDLRQPRCGTRYNASCFCI